MKRTAFPALIFIKLTNAVQHLYIKFQWTNCHEMHTIPFSFCENCLYKISSKSDQKCWK